uniref:Uncharacterized protein n=1 Tax=Anguilla anguilla TaxID=7936 RepID=A0A0E9RJ50_ANGAN
MLCASPLKFPLLRVC